jgi:hypothetical protein
VRKFAAKLRLSRETLRQLTAHEARRAAGQALPSALQGDCTEGSCTYFICEPSNPWPCNTVITEKAVRR